MRRLILLAAVATLFLVALPVASAVAAPPEQVVIQGPAFFGGSNADTGDFTASGPAEVSGTICDQGTTRDLEKSTHQTRKGVHLRVLKEFTCDDSSGTFQLELKVRIPNGQLATFQWVVVGGTGNYANLKGNGSGFALNWIPAAPPAAIGVTDVYTGKLH